MKFSLSSFVLHRRKTIHIAMVGNASFVIRCKKVAKVAKYNKNLTEIKRRYWTLDAQQF